MRKIGLLVVASLLLSGCATYKFQKGAAPYDKGYVASYDGKPIPEYTLGQDNSVPDLALAKERFNRRRSKVEYYYKKMGQIEARFKELFWDPPAMCLDFICGIFRWPFVAVADYKYNRNPQYKEKVDRMDEQKDELEKARINDLKVRLRAYIDEDLAKESGKKEPPAAQPLITESPVDKVTVTLPVEATKSEPVKLAEIAQPVAAPPQESIPAMPKEDKIVLPAADPVKLEPPHAVIIAKPVSGPSPLQVNFNGGKSYSKSGKIVSYAWDFGDGDISTKKNPVNIYWSTTYGSRIFTATLTVKDEKGQIASVSKDIQVVTK